MIFKKQLILKSTIKDFEKEAQKERKKHDVLHICATLLSLVGFYQTFHSISNFGQLTGVCIVMMGFFIMFNNSTAFKIAIATLQIRKELNDKK